MERVQKKEPIKRMQKIDRLAVFFLEVAFRWIYASALSPIESLRLGVKGMTNKPYCLADNIMSYLIGS